MDKTRIYHVLSALFGALALLWGAIELSSSFTLTAVLFVAAGLGMLATSGVALVRPDLVSSDEPATWKIAMLAIGVLVFGAGIAVMLA